MVAGPQQIYLWRGYHGAEFAKLFAQCWGTGALLIACPPTTIDFSFVEQLPDADVRLAGDWTSGMTSVAELPPPHADYGQAPPVYPKAPVLGVFTSGTSRSQPKLVLYSRDNILASQQAICALFDMARITTVFCYPQPYHVFGLLLGFALSAERQAQVIYADGPYSRHAHELWLAQADSGMLTLATPSHMHDLCTYLETNGQTPRPTYTCILGGAKVDRRIWCRTRDVARIAAPSIGYGCTEASPGLFHLPPGVEPTCDGEVGVPLRGVELDFTVRQGADGLPAKGFLFRGPSLCLATIEGDKLSFPTAHYVPDELVPHPGSEPSRLVFAGRSDLVLNRGGEKFSLEGIEALLKAKHDIDSICVAVPDSRLGFELGIVARSCAGVGVEAIYQTLNLTYQRQFSRNLLQIVDALPLDRNAKPDRRAAADRFHAVSERGLWRNNQVDGQERV